MKICQTIKLQKKTKTGKERWLLFPTSQSNLHPSPSFLHGQGMKRKLEPDKEEEKTDFKMQPSVKVER